MIDPFPLQFPPNQARTSVHQRQKSTVKVGFRQARDELLKELELLGAAKVVISSNLPLRQDGLPYANSREPNDPGVALYFTWNKKEYCFACDGWDKTTANLRAIGLHIAALRPILTDRYRVGTAEQAISGYQVLPPAKTDWRSILGISTVNPSVEQVRSAYRAKSAKAHPDAGGRREDWDRIQVAYQEALQQITNT